MAIPAKKIALTSPDQIFLQFMPSSRFTSAILHRLDGKTSLKTIFNSIRHVSNATNLTDMELRENFRPGYEILNNISWLLLRHGSITLHPTKLPHEIIRKNTAPHSYYPPERLLS